MNRTFLRGLAAAIVIPSLLAACGGGDPPAANPLASRIGKETPQVRSLAAPDRRAAGSGGGAIAVAAVANITITQLLEWAEFKFPTLFPDGPQNVQIVHEGVSYTIRYYPTTDNYLGVTEGGEIFGLGAFTGFALVSFGRIGDYMELICTDLPGFCNPTDPPAGSLNECVDPAYATLPTGYRTAAVYALGGIASGEQTQESQIDGPETYRGQNAIKVTTVVKGSTTIAGFTVPNELKSIAYDQTVGSGRPPVTLGVIAEVKIGEIPGLPIPIPGLGETSVSETVFDPAYQNLGFTIALGQSVTDTSTGTTTILSGTGAGTAPQTHTNSTTYTYEARETIAVQGRNYDTCRYRVSTPGVVDPTTSWYIVGKGVLAKSITPSDEGDTILELKSGTVNGQPL